MISNGQKLLIGAMGGFALGILKLMQLNFFLDVDKPAVVIGGCLTLAAYLVLGTLVGFFFGEERAEDKNKTRKNAFIMGLLAPSVLLAITTKPVTTKDVDLGQASGVPVLHGSILDLLVPGAYAQTPEPAASPATPIKFIEQKGTASELGTGVKSALGIQQPAEQAVYVVGKTTNQAVATKTAEEINKLLTKTDSGTKVQATIIKPESTNQFYVAVGGVTSSANATVNEKAAKATALKTFVEPATAKEKETAKVLSSGDVVSGSSLFKN